MLRIDPSDRSRTHIWIALAGALVLAVLAIGLLQTGAKASPPAGAAGYGTPTGNGKAPCRKSTGGYQSVPCPSQVSGVATSPVKPTAGNGFKVGFKSTSGGAYTVSATKGSKTTQLETGATGTGKTTTKKVGKKLKAGKYVIKVSVNSGAGKADSAKKSVTIKK
jgi:hypothetical protein